MPQLFSEGAIVKISLTNFVTFDSVVLRPGPSLNVIIGPNGTGKSSIVCAICLGLGGKPNLLGRASRPADFIQHGHNKAIVELELFNADGDNRVVRREIDKNTSKWYINGRSANLKVVEEMAQRLNIHVNNLCQFLPQDKVADFAKMSSQELLDNTERAVGSENLYDRHQRLKVCRGQMRDLESCVKQTTKLLDDEKIRNSRLEDEVKSHEQREDHLKRVKMLKIKKCWVEYSNSREFYCEEKKRKEELSSELAKGQCKHEPLLDKLNAMKVKSKEIDDFLKKKGEAMRASANDAHDSSQKMDAITDQMIEVNDLLKTKQQEDSRQERKLTEMSKQLQSLQTELNNLDDTDVQPALITVRNEITNASRQAMVVKQDSNSMRSDIDHKQASLQGHKSELRGLQDVQNQRTENLKHYNRDTYTATMWLRDNKHRFKHTIHEPILLTINMKRTEFAKYLENHVPSKDMYAFVCEDKDDMNLFTDLVRDQQNLRVSVVCDPKTQLSELKPKKSIQYYSKHGFHSYLSEMFTCPDPVMRYLCVQYHVHQIPIGNKYTKEHMEQVLNECSEFRKIFTDNHKYTVTFSRYSKMKSTSSAELRPASLLTVAFDIEREQYLNAQIQNLIASISDMKDQLATYDEQYKHYEQQLHVLRRRQKDLVEQRDSKKNLQAKVNMKQKSISDLEGNRIDIKREEALTDAKIKDLIFQQCDFLVNMKNQIKQCIDISIERVRYIVSQVSIQAERIELENSLKDRTQELYRKQAEVNELKKTLVDIRGKTKKLLEHAQTMSGGEYNAEEFRRFPETIAKLDEAIHEEQARADCVYTTDPDAVKDYNEGQKIIQRLTEKLDEEQGRLNDHIQLMSNAKTQWIEPLQSLIENINTNFCEYFSKLDCAGEIDLAVPDNPEDYERYGIRIKVKFRHTDEMRELNPYHQSGGERSVSTMLYLMSLQKLTSVPFRCVDEINQGMDVHNERKVFDLIVKTSCTESSAQYFLLTPKLLPDLNYAPEMTVLCVYNGPKVPNHTDWDVDKFIRCRSRMKPSRRH